MESWNKVTCFISVDDSVSVSHFQWVWSMCVPTINTKLTSSFHTVIQNTPWWREEDRGHNDLQIHELNILAKLFSLRSPSLPLLVKSTVPWIMPCQVNRWKAPNSSLVPRLSLHTNEKSKGCTASAGKLGGAWKSGYLILHDTVSG